MHKIYWSTGAPRYLSSTLILPSSSTSRLLLLSRRLTQLCKCHPSPPISVDSLFCLTLCPPATPPSLRHPLALPARPPATAHYVSQRTTTSTCLRHPILSSDLCLHLITDCNHHSPGEDAAKMKESTDSPSCIIIIIMSCRWCCCSSTIWPPSSVDLALL